jgi:serine/threonine protein kinase
MLSLDGYTLKSRIRATVRASLFRGYRDADQLPVVVKVLRAEHPSAEELARLRHQHAVLRSLDSPHVARALGLEKYGHGLALVMEDAGERSLETLIQSSEWDLEKSLQIAVALAEVVASIHQQHIVHKDIKPHHFCLSAADHRTVKLIDFGIATRLSQELGTASPLNQLEGTLAYIAPEQTGRMNRIIDRRSDLYSLGVTLYQLFARRLPFEATDLLELVHSHIAKVPPAPRDVKPEIPAVVSDIILKLLAKAAEDRYQSASGLQHDLQRCLVQLKTTGRIEPFPLARADESGELSIPQKLYGREGELGELHAAFSATGGLYDRLWAGEGLDSVEAGIDAAQELARRTDDVANQANVTLQRQYIAALRGQTRSPESLEDGSFSEASFAAELPPAVIGHYGVAKTTLHYLAGNYREALEAADACQLLPCIFYHTEHRL